MNKLGFHLIDKTNEDFESCLDCVHADDSEETCTLRKCVHAIKYLYDHYEKADRKDVPDTNVGKWTPVSERLPDKDFTDFLVQIGHGKYAVYETAYRVRGRWVFYSDRIDGEGQSVIAWMECPKPYKAESEES